MAAQLKTPPTLSSKQASGVACSSSQLAARMPRNTPRAPRPSGWCYQPAHSPCSRREDLERAEDDPSVDVILESVNLDCLTNTPATSIWSYRQFYGPDAEKHASPRWHIGDNKPFGFSWFRLELSPMPKAWVERTGDNLLFYRQHDQGGHFAALELPKLLWADVEEFLKLDAVRARFRV
ncbi:uncharacterized protein A1O9_02813 [Exophiala aquamarina CBS 119918]|uniref:Epoxide hydrolase n=1 Tax=Exophiala aquamarina CBS 119918 TaxID=1182545 RepID=A0A072PPI8_9EURO|nr:uncharacterized protein A1O9_02813 [Exophiala aquamarina CBS 119918]KEF61248.1 hypothetical protein A1O9_02813 [Exophiala aquamarina CBS 119918]